MPDVSSWGNLVPLQTPSPHLLQNLCADPGARRWLDTRWAASEGTSLGALALSWTFAGQLAAAVGASRTGGGDAQVVSCVADTVLRLTASYRSSPSGQAFAGWLISKVPTSCNGASVCHCGVAVS